MVAVATKEAVEAMDMVLVVEYKVAEYMEEESVVVKVNFIMALISVTLVGFVLMKNVKKPRKKLEKN